MFHKLALIFHFKNFYFTNGCYIAHIFLILAKYFKILYFTNLASTSEI